MAIAISGDGTITGISVGGIPDGVVDTDVLAANAVTYAKIGTTEQGQLCKAWVNFDGTGTVAIRASYNVSSITDNGTGDYTVNFTTALADTNYAVAVTHQYQTGTGFSDTISSLRNGSYPLATGSVRVQHYSTSGAYDAVVLCVSVFR